MKRIYLAAFLLFSLASALAAQDRADIIVNDFEADTYGSWKVEGEAFGPGPARGTLPNQMRVAGFLGKGLVNTYFKGDDTTGSLTSPPIKLERRYVNFLIGGGGYEKETCINLIIEGKVVLSTPGPNLKPGGTEALEWASWDVKDFAGKEAVFQIVDNRKGGWGHINIDQITLSDKRPAVAEPAVIKVVIDKPYLLLPVKNGGTKRRVKLFDDKVKVREFEIELALGETDWWSFTDVSALKGKTLMLDAGRMIDPAKHLAAIRTSDTVPEPEKMYREKLRPQFHFTSRRGWLNDPNGLVFYKDEWHLFYQHNPFGWNWENMHWGHAVSKDLLHWEERPDALYPWADAKGHVFSGSAVVDKHNTSGWKSGDDDVIVAAFTDTGAGESIAYSTDRARTFKLHKDNPVVKHVGRDPKLVWHERAKRWIMAVYTEAEGKQWIAFHSSSDLKSWRFESRIEGFFECPDLFELPVISTHVPQPRLWVLYAADGQYVLGSFDGVTFKKESPAGGGKHRLWHGNFYAAQTYDNAPENRRIQIGWGQNISFPGMPFNQQMVVPVELTLRPTAEGVRMFAEPVRELASLRAGSTKEKVELNGAERATEKTLDFAGGELLDVEASYVIQDKALVTLNVRGVAVTYDAEKQTITCNRVSAPLKLVEGKLHLRVLVDRGSIEVFGNGGTVAMSVGVHPAENERRVKLGVQRGAAEASVTVHELKSVWR